MKKIYQTRFGNPGGNCHQAAMASLLELELSQVPDFCNDSPNKWWSLMVKWLNRKGYGVAAILMNDRFTPICCSVAGLCLLGVASSNDPSGMHSVVGTSEITDGKVNLKVVFDPNPNASSKTTYEIKDAIWIVKNAVK